MFTAQFDGVSDAEIRRGSIRRRGFRHIEAGGQVVKRGS